ncbi:MAG: type II secretion system F family protein, partial [Armatimonadota bacterium]|nr:type II secretion system F family protein [Armatimonadota bacterium]
MAVFVYVAKNAKTGKKTKGTQEADSASDAQLKLQERGLRVMEMAEEVKKKKGAGINISFGGVKLKDKSIFCRQFATMVNAGVHLVRCLDVLEEQCSNPKMKMTIHDVRLDVEGGANLSQALAKHPKVFDNLFLGLVKAGEVGGA